MRSSSCGRSSVRRRPNGLAGIAAAACATLSIVVACSKPPTQPPRFFGPTRGEAVDPNPDPPDPPLLGGDCATDADCVMTNFTDCCACCECTKPPYAIAHAKLHEREARCADTDCPLAGCNTKKCPPCTPTSAKAVCEDGQCVER